MAKNLIPEIAKLLGVELGEEFKIDGYGEVIYMITDNGLMATDDDTKTEWTPANGLFVALLNGKEEIIDLPWKPKHGEKYYTFCRCLGQWHVSQQQWTKHPFDLALLDKDWVFRTREEAEAALPAVAKEMGVEYEL